MSLLCWCVEKNIANDRKRGNGCKNKKHHQGRKLKDEKLKHGGKQSRFESRFKGNKKREYYQTKGKPSEISGMMEPETLQYSKHASTKPSTVEYDDTSSKEEEKLSQDYESQTSHSDSEQLIQMNKECTT